MQDFVACKVPFFGGTEPKLFLLKRETRKIVLVMKITAVLLLAAVLQVSAKSWGQEKITLSFNNAPLEQVLNSIHSQANVEFIYRTDYVKDKKVTVNVSNASLKTVLDLCLQNQQLTYDIFGKNVSIHPEKREKAPGNGTPQINGGANGEIKGHVANDKGEPLAGANITVKRTGKGTITDANGNFKLSDITGDDIIVISYVGYQAQSLKIGDKPFISLALGEANNELDKVVMQAYGQTTKRLATGNIAKVTSEEIERQPVMNTLQALQGRVPGLVVTQTNGFASAPFKVEIRGRNTIDPHMPSDPLYIIDGVPLTIVEVGGGSSYLGGSKGFLQNGFAGPALGQSPLFNINPNDIESIEVLKDADATAIYGSRASNGVILITTKKGNVGKTKLDISINTGNNKITRYWDMLNTEQYLAMRREAFANSGQPIRPGNAPDILVWDTSRYTNWQKVLWGGMGKNTNIQMGLSGGDIHTSFRMSAGYNRLTDITAVSGANQRASVSFNINHHSIDEKLAVVLSGNYAFTQVDMVDMPSNIVTLPPDAPAIWTSEGKLNYNGWEPIRYLFPFSGLLQPYTSKTHFLNSNLEISYQLFKGVKIKSNFGYNTAQAMQSSFTPIVSQDSMNLPTGKAIFGNNLNRNWIIEPQIEYTSYLGKGKFTVLLGASAQGTVTDGQFLSGDGYTSDALLKTISNAPTQYATDNYGQYKYEAVFGRVNYSLFNRYLINLAGRRDGSSNFGEGNQFGNFGSVGAAWIFSDEKWFSGLNHIISFGKLRASYGTTGGEGPAYGYLTRYQSVNPSYNGTQPLVPTQHANPDYRWQVNKKLESAIDIGLFQDRLNFSVAYYQNRCNNQLVQFPLPTFTGFPNVIANSPANVQNKGWEILSGIKIIKSKDIMWAVNFNVAINRNKLISYPNIELSPYYGLLYVGQSLNIVRLLHYTGVDPQTGLYTFQDKNKDGTINASQIDSITDYFNYDLSPKFTGGFGTSLGYKGFNLSVVFNFAKQKGRNAYAGLYGGSMKNLPTAVLSHWKKTGDVSQYARFTTIPDITDAEFSNQSDGAYTDASFIRLQNLSLSYSVAEKIRKKMGLHGLSIYVQAQNLFIITKYKGIDPETQNFGGMPPVKTVVGGISINL